MIPLEIRHVARRFGRIEALRGISLEVKDGEVFGYLGPNGAGKTTTLRIVMGLVRADRGDARVCGALAGSTAAHLAVGYLPGDLHLYGDMNAGELLDYFARFRPAHTPVLRPSLIEALSLDGATLSRRTKLLSHGTRQKLGIIIALQHDPKVWLLDEPTVGLDPLVQQGFRAIVRAGAARGRAILLSSHVLSEVEAVCGRVGILRAGELVAVETIAELRRRTVRRLAVRFKGPAPGDLAGIPGVARATIDGSEAVLWLQGDVNPVLRRLATADVDQIVFPEPELEDIFLAYYERGGAADG